MRKLSLSAILVSFLGISGVALANNTAPSGQYSIDDSRQSEFYKSVAVEMIIEFIDSRSQNQHICYFNHIHMLPRSFTFGPKGGHCTNPDYPVQNIKLKWRKVGNTQYSEISSKVYSFYDYCTYSAHVEDGWDSKNNPKVRIEPFSCATNTANKN